MDITITTEHTAGAAILNIAGEVDLYTASELREGLAQLINAGESEIVLDLSETTFIDSVGFGAILGAYRQLRESNGRMLLVASREVERAMQTIGLERVLTLYSNRVDALSSLIYSA